MKLSDYVIKRISREVKHIFLLPGGGCMHLLDSVGRCKDVEYICNLHEQASAIAADAYGQYTNNLGVALVTTGPGGSNAITGVAGAWLDSTPCLFLSGQVKREDLIGDRGVRQMGFQELNITKIVEPITKYAVTITEPSKIKYHLEKAIYLAKNGRPGPVWLDIPLDVQSAFINESTLLDFIPQVIKCNKEYLKQAVEKSIQLINQAQRPIILVGNGVRLGNALSEFKTLAELLNIPILTTWRAADFLPEEHPLFIGRPGAVGQRGANFAQQNSDLIIVLGARLDLGQTGYNHQNFARLAKKIIVDVDYNEINKMDMVIDMPVCCDIKEFVEEMMRQKVLLISKQRKEWWARCKEWKRKYPVILTEYWEERDGVNTYVLIDALSRELNENDLLIPGSSGTCAEITMQAIKVKEGLRIFNNPGLGAMGFGIPAAIGGCLAAGKKRTICIDGDGGFQMNIQELETIRRLGLPIKFFVLNNNGYASIQTTQRTHFNGYYVASNEASGLTLPNLSKQANSYEIYYTKINENSEVKQQVRDIIEYNGPVICEVMITPNQYTAPRISSVQDGDGKMISKPLEDLWPFLDRKEYQSNLLK